MSAPEGAKTQRLSSKAKSAPPEQILHDLLAESPSILASIVDNLPVALFVKDADHDFRVVLWNKKQEDITTIPREKALGRTDFHMFSGICPIFPSGR
ncbi:MAG: PAS domain-containing protein [Verrucomicrobiales bacterium]